MLKTFQTPWRAVALIAAALMLTACQPMTNAAGATETALCRTWGESLPTRSRSDTPQTITEIGNAYSDFAAACPKFQDLIP